MVSRETIKHHEIKVKSPSNTEGDKTSSSCSKSNTPHNNQYSGCKWSTSPPASALPLPPLSWIPKKSEKLEETGSIDSGLSASLDSDSDSGSREESQFSEVSLLSIPSENVQNESFIGKTIIAKYTSGKFTHFCIES